MSSCIYHFQEQVGFCPVCKLYTCVTCLSQHLDHLPHIIIFKNLLSRLEDLYLRMETLNVKIETNISSTKGMIKNCRNEVGLAFEELQLHLATELQKLSKQSSGRRCLNNIQILKRNDFTNLKTQDLQILNNMVKNHQQNQVARDYQYEIQQLDNTLNRYQMELQRISNIVQLNYLGSKDYEKGDELYRNGKYQQALEVYNKAIDDMIRKIGLRQNNFKMFQNHIDSCKKINDQTQLIRVYENLCLLDPHNPDYRQELGNIYKNKNMNVEALSYYNQAAKVQAATPSILTNQANCYLSLGLQQKALSHFEQAARLEPQEPKHYYNQGVVYRNQGNINKAELFFNKAKNLGINQPSKNTALQAESQINAQRYDLALQSYQRMLLSDPRNPTLHARKGYLQFMIGHYEQSIQSYQQALSLNPNNPQYISAINKASQQLQNRRQTFSDLKPIIIRQSSRGSLANFARRTPLTLSEADNYLNQNPSDASLWYQKGMILQRAGKNGDALGCYQRALQLNPSQPKYIQAQRGIQLMIKKKQRKCF